MAAPNLLAPTTLLGKTAVLAVTTTPTAIVTNAPSSGKVLMVGSLSVSNVDGTTDADITIDVFRSSTATHIGKTISITQNQTLLVITKDMEVWLEEGDSLRLTSSANGDLEAVLTYKEIS